MRPLRRNRLCRATAAAAVAALATAVPAAAVTTRDTDDTPVLLDIERMAVNQVPSGRVTVRVSMFEAWSANVLSPGTSGPPGSVCLLVWTRRPLDQAPDYLVCATPRGPGRLAGTVLREPTGAGLPRRVGAAVVTRPTSKSVELSFAPSDLGNPTLIRYVAEAAQPAGCPPPRGCVDRTRSARLTLRSTAR